MPFFKTAKLALIIGLSISFVSVIVPDEAQAETFLERLFKKRLRRNVKPELPPVVIKKVSAPKYFGYSVTALKPIDFAPLIAMANSAIELDGLQTGSNVLPAAEVASSNLQKSALENQAFLEAVLTLGNSKIMARADIAKAVTEYYRSHPDFIWLENGKPTFSSQQVLELFAQVDGAGLDSRDYRVVLPASESDAQELAKYEFSLSVMAVRYGLDARNGRINPNRLSGYHDFPKSKFDAAIAMEQLASAVSPSAYLAASHPGSEKFLALRKELAALGGVIEDVIEIADGTLIKPGKSHEELPNVIAAIRKKGSVKLLQRHGEALTAYSRTQLFSPQLVLLVKDFQQEMKLKPDGVVGANTISKLVDVSAQVKIERVRMAMERLRWHPHRLGARHVFINQPAYRARYISEGQEKLSMRAIVGKRSNQTSFFYDSIERVEFNPYWGVPQSIIINEMLPKLRADPSYLDARGYEVTTQGGQKLSSASINWHSLGAGQVPYNVRQLPGAKNALGELKILFPNKHAIYMHDTPSRGLFKRTRRALSHGCVRLQNPRGMAAAVLGTTVSTIASKINSGKNNALELRARIPVYVAYFTAWPNKDGEVEYFTDIYDRDKHLQKAMDKLSVARGNAV